MHYNPSLTRAALLVAASMLAAACASKQTPPPAMQTSVSAPSVTREAPAQAYIAPQGPVSQATILPGSLKDFEVNVGDRVSFTFDSANLDDTAHSTLQKQAAWLNRYPRVSVVIQGYCDERGTREYNLALGARRAASAKDYLVSLGVDGHRLDTISYGKERPVCSESNEACWAQNRRAVSALTGEASPNVAAR
jgi:peptidoglycan-associated lipoprotein